MSVRAPTERRRGFWYGLGAVGAGALALRLWVVLVQRPTATSGIPGDGTYVLGGDAFYYHWQSRAIADGLGLIDPVSWRELGVLLPSAGHVPLYSGFLGVVSWFGAESVTAHRVASSVLGVVGVVVIAVLARNLAGDRAGLIAGTIAALYPQLWINDGMLLSETIAIVAVAVVLLVAYQLWRRPTIPWAVGLGVAIAVATLARPEQILLFVFVAFPLIMFFRELAWRWRLQLVAATAATGLVVLAPWLVYTTTAFERPALLTTGSGIVLARGSCDEVFYGEYIGYYARCVEQFPPLAIDETERNAIARRRAFDYLDDHLDRLPVVAAARVGRIWGAFEPAQTTNLDWQLEGRGRAASWAGLWSYYALVPLAVAGLVVARRRGIPISPIVGLAAIVTVTAAMSFGVTRYRAPAEVGIVVAAALAVDAAAGGLLARRRARRHTADDGSAPEAMTVEVTHA